MSERSKIPPSAYKVAVFAVITTLLTGVLAALIGNLSFAPSREYYALFTDATGVFKGDRVRLSGVEVGSVKSVELVERDGRALAKVRFRVADTVPLYADAHLRLRYENIVGQRYLSIEETPGDGREVQEGAVFDVDQTSPALNLTQLFNGFQPLFEALDPAQLGVFSEQVIRALEGDHAMLAGLMRSTAELTNSLADRDRVIGDLVDNLNVVLATVGDRDQQVTRLVVDFRKLVQGFAKDSAAIGADLDPLADLLDTTMRTVARARPGLRQTVRTLNPLVAELARDRDVLDGAVKELPGRLRTLARTGSYGSWFNFYVCGLELNITLLDGTVPLRGLAMAANEKDTVCSGGER